MQPKSLKARIGSNLARLRKERGFSQESLAHECGLEVTTVASIERARRLPSVPTLVALAGALQVTPNELLGSTVQPRLTQKQQKLYALTRFLATRKASEIDLVMDLARRVLEGPRK